MFDPTPTAAHHLNDSSAGGGRPSTSSTSTSTSTSTEYGTSAVWRERPVCRFENRLVGWSLELQQPVRRITARQRDELPAAWQAIEAARQAGHWVALLLNYELGAWLLDPPTAQSGRSTPPNPGSDSGSGSGSGSGSHLPSHASPGSPPNPPPDAPPLTALVFAQADERGTRPRCAVGSGQAPATAPAPAADAQTGDAAHPTDAARSMRPGITQARHAQAIGAIRAGIARGDYYQINYTLPLRLDWPDSLDPVQAYERLLARHPVAHAACIHDAGRWILSLSPELFVAREASRLHTRPMKGTAPRHRDPERDRQVAQALLHSEKNRAENLMIVDLLRNDLGRIATPGSVRVPALFTLEAYPSVWTLTSSVQAEAPGVPLQRVLEALFPCGSITGAPKIAAMRAIEALEQRARGIYCGSVGWLAPDGDFSLNVAIRTIELRDGQAQFGVGGGIVHDSQADEEWQECLWKARILQGWTFEDPQHPISDPISDT